jgi:transposase InsO family protein
VFEHFQSLILRLNNEQSNYLKAIRSDNEIEFINASFDEFCLEYDIDQQFSTSRVPQQNGVIERKTRTLVEMARMCLMSIGLLGALGSMLLALLAMFQIESFCARFYI